MNLEEFVRKASCRNQWISEDYLAAYVRRSVRFIDNQMVPCFDIASVEINVGYHNKGIFTDFLRRFEDFARKDNCYVFVESIQTDFLLSFLLKNGYKETGWRCVYKKP
jgi:hypothetical protein